jgi:hypothetical protein
MWVAAIAEKRGLNGDTRVQALRHEQRRGAGAGGWARDAGSYLAYAS